MTMHIELVNCPPLVLVLLLVQTSLWQILLQEQHYLNVVTEVEKWVIYTFL